MDDCHVEPAEKTATPTEKQAKAATYLIVSGLGCPNCAARVHNSLLALCGVTDAYVDHQTGMALVEFNPDLVTIPALFEAIAQAGNDGLHLYRAFRLT